MKIFESGPCRIVVASIGELAGYFASYAASSDGMQRFSVNLPQWTSLKEIKGKTL
jgi:hypothetical protein